MQHDARAILEAERRRIAEQLQQQVSEPLGLLLEQITIYERALGRDAALRGALAVLAALARQALQQTQDLAEGLSPLLLERQGLAAALELLANQAARSAMRIDLQLCVLAARPPAELELALYRLAQAACERAVRSARARRMRIALEQQQDQLLLVLQDDGDGQLGLEQLAGARQLLQSLGAHVEFSSPGRGLLIHTSCSLLAAHALTPREREVLELIAAGKSNKQIGHQLEISPRTVNYHLENIFTKLGVATRAEAAVFAVRHGFAGFTQPAAQSAEPAAISTQSETQAGSDSRERR